MHTARADTIVELPKQLRKSTNFAALENWTTDHWPGCLAIPSTMQGKPRRSCPARMPFESDHGNSVPRGLALYRLLKSISSVCQSQFVKSNFWDSWLLVTLTGSTTVAPRFRPGLKPGWASSEAVGKVWQDRSFFWILVELMKILRIVWNWLKLSGFHFNRFSGVFFFLCLWLTLQLHFLTLCNFRFFWPRSLASHSIGFVESRAIFAGTPKRFAAEWEGPESPWKSRSCWKILKGVWKIMTSN